ENQKSNLHTRWNRAVQAGAPAPVPLENPESAEQARITLLMNPCSPMLISLVALLVSLRSIVRSRLALQFEILSLRQQKCTGSAETINYPKSQFRINIRQSSTIVAWMNRRNLQTEPPMISQANISPNTPMGANLVAGGGATFRAWGPLASAVYINGIFGGTPMNGQTDNLLLAKDAQGYWAGFVAGAQEGDPYRFWVEGPGGKGDKRDPYARELSPAAAFPDCDSLI